MIKIVIFHQSYRFFVEFSSCFCCTSANALTTVCHLISLQPSAWMTEPLGGNACFIGTLINSLNNSPHKKPFINWMKWWQAPRAHPGRSCWIILSLNREWRTEIRISCVYRHRPESSPSRNITSRQHPTNQKTTTRFAISPRRHSTSPKTRRRATEATGQQLLTHRRWLSTTGKPSSVVSLHKCLCPDVFLGKERLSSEVELGRSRTCRRRMMKSCIYESKLQSWTAASWMSRSTTCSEPNARKLYVASASLTLFWRRSSGLTESKKLPKLFKFCDRSNRRWASKLLNCPIRATFLLKLIATIGAIHSLC